MNEKREESEARPAIVLVEPQLGENIGATARAMLNCGLEDLRLVRPRDGWPNPAAWAMASGADRVLDQVRVCDSLPEAVADLHKIYATTARHRYMVKFELTPKRLAQEIHLSTAAGARSGILFGRERTGLENDEVALADAVVVVPLNPDFTSLNLAQAVLLVAYEWFQARAEAPEKKLVLLDTRPATQEERHLFFTRLEKTLEETNFFRTEAMRETQWRKVQNLFSRADLTEQELRILHGMLSAFEGRRLR
jgi:tRNA/rRNA methyltransferase